MIFTNPAEFFAALPQSTSRIIGLDLGQRRIGAALLHLTTGVTSPIGMIQRQGPISKDIEAINKLIREWDAGGVVVGVPVNMDGTEGDAAKAAHKFIVKLISLKIPVIGHDERLSTKGAHSLMKSHGHQRKDRHQADDMISASLIIEHFYASYNSNNR